MKQVRQGDVLLRAVSADVERGKRVDTGSRVILAYGEVTGHHHSLDARKCDLYEGEHPVLVVREPDVLVHQEHAGIEIAPGTYWVVLQREYTPAAIRRVAD
jgi:hypothetical protein